MKNLKNKFKKLFTKKGSSEFITTLILIALFGAAGFTVFSKIGSTYKQSNGTVTNNVGSQLNTAGNSIQFNAN